MPAIGRESRLSWASPDSDTKSDSPELRRGIYHHARRPWQPRPPRALDERTFGNEDEDEAALTPEDWEGVPISIKVNLQAGQPSDHVPRPWRGRIPTLPFSAEQTTRLDVSAAIINVDDENRARGQLIIDNASPKPDNADEPVKALRWSHLQSTEMDFESFRLQCLKEAPNHVIPAIAQLLKLVRSKFDRSFVHGHYIEPGSVLRCDGTDRGRAYNLDPHVTFFCLPYLAVCPLIISSNNQLHPPRTVMQFSYDHESTRNHDSQQTFRQFPKVQSSDYLQVFQLWMVLIKSGNSRPSATGVCDEDEIIISCAADTLEDIFGRDIEQSVQAPESSKRPTGIQVVDVYDRFHYFAVDQNMTFYELQQNVVEKCLKDTSLDLEDCELSVIGRDEELTADQWPQTITSATSAFISLRLTKRNMTDPCSHDERPTSRRSHLQASRPVSRVYSLRPQSPHLDDDGSPDSRAWTQEYAARSQGRLSRRSSFAPTERTRLSEYHPQNLASYSQQRLRSVRSRTNSVSGNDTRPHSRQDAIIINDPTFLEAELEMKPSICRIPEDTSQVSTDANDDATDLGSEDDGSDVGIDMEKPFDRDRNRNGDDRSESPKGNSPANGFTHEGKFREPENIPEYFGDRKDVGTEGASDASFGSFDSHFQTGRKAGGEKTAASEGRHEPEEVLRRRYSDPQTASLDPEQTLQGTQDQEFNFKNSNRAHDQSKAQSTPKRGVRFIDERSSTTREPSDTQDDEPHASVGAEVFRARPHRLPRSPSRGRKKTKAYGSNDDHWADNEFHLVSSNDLREISHSRSRTRGARSQERSRTARSLSSRRLPISRPGSEPGDIQDLDEHLEKLYEARLDEDRRREDRAKAIREWELREVEERLIKAESKANREWKKVKFESPTASSVDTGIELIEEDKHISKLHETVSIGRPSLDRKPLNMESGVPPFLTWATKPNLQESTSMADEFCTTGQAPGDLMDESLKYVLSQIEKRLRSKTLDASDIDWVQLKRSYVRGKIYTTTPERTVNDLESTLERLQAWSSSSTTNTVSNPGLHMRTYRNLCFIAEEISSIITNSRELMALLAPDSYQHAVLKKFWAALIILVESFERAAKESLKVEYHKHESSMEFYIVDLEPLISDYKDAAIVRPERPIEGCETCLIRHDSYSSAFQHLHDNHFVQEDPSCRQQTNIWHWVCSSRQAKLENRNLELLGFLKLISHRVLNLRNTLASIKHGVATGENSVSAKFALPTSLVRAATFSIEFILLASFCFRDTTAPLDIVTGKRKGMRFDTASDLVDSFGVAAEILLMDAEHDFILMARAGITDTIGITHTSVGLESIALLAIIDLVQRPLHNDQRVLELYQRHLSRLRYEVSVRPQKRLLRDLYHFQEELLTLREINAKQWKLFDSLNAVIDPRSYRVTSQAQIADYKFNHVLMRSIWGSLEKQDAQYEELYKNSISLGTVTRHSIEILEEGHGKAILVFTIVTIVFLPLSFVATLLGMNTIDIRDMDRNQSLFWEVALPLTSTVVALSLLVAYKGVAMSDALWSFKQRVQRKREYRKRSTELPFAHSNQSSKFVTDED